MTISRPKRLGALVLAASFAAAACSGSGASSAPSAAASDGAAPSRRRVHGPRRRAPSSSTAPAPSTRSPRPSPRSSAPAQPGVDVSVAESGTGGGFKKFCAGETDINDASRPIKEDDERRRRRLRGQRRHVRPAPGRHRRPDGRRQPGEHLGDLPDARAAGHHLRPGLAREPELERTSTRASRTSRSSATCRAPTPAPSTTSPKP